MKMLLPMLSGPVTINIFVTQILGYASALAMSSWFLTNLKAYLKCAQVTLILYLFTTYITERKRVAPHTRAGKRSGSPNIF